MAGRTWSEAGEPRRYRVRALVFLAESFRLGTLL